MTRLLPAGQPREQPSCRDAFHTRFLRALPGILSRMHKAQPGHSQHLHKRDCEGLDRAFQDISTQHAPEYLHESIALARWSGSIAPAVHAVMMTRQLPVQDLAEKLFARLHKSGGEKFEARLGLMQVQYLPISKAMHDPAS